MLTADLTKYHRQIRTWILESKAVSFSQLVRNLHGVYPTDVATALESLRNTHNVGHLLPGRSETILPHRKSDWLPVPHPLDYDWRFTDATIRSLIDVVRAECNSFQRFCGFGCASIIPELSQKYPQIASSILDWNPLIKAALKKHFPFVSTETFDLTREFRGHACEMDVVLLDPPWYPPKILPFVWNARRICRQGGILLVCLPSQGTRSSIDTERTQLIQYVDYCGLEMLSYHEAFLRYESPPFERNALAAAGLSNTPLDWRVGDLMILRATGPLEVPCPPQPRGGVKWTEIRPLGVRVKVKVQPDRDKGSALLQSLIPNDVLNTVSQRDTRLPDVQVWTMGNRVFGCECTAKFARIVERFRTGQLIRIADTAVIEQIERLVDAELHFN